MKIYFDGGCRPNPGMMELAIVAGGLSYHEAEVGPGSSLEAEWRALFRALEIGSSLGVSDLTLLGDSAEVIGKAAGRLRTRTAQDQRWVEQFREATAGFVKVRLKHVRRSQNLAGIALTLRRKEPWRSPGRGSRR
jgi:ribonuclease HI